jgi:very-short-patch-repair endonuclease
VRPESRPRELRKTPTAAEQRLRSRLRQQQLGCKFRRQHPVGGYIADFACIEHRLIVEADGGQHAENPGDAIRTQRLQALGWRVIRFWNHEILETPDGVLVAIKAALKP